MFGHFGWYSRDGFREALFYIPFHQYYFIGPVLYLYVLSLTTGKSLPKAWIHFLPGLIYLLYSLVIFITDYLMGTPFFYADGRDKDLSFSYQILGMLSITIYLVLAIRDHRRHRRSILHEVSYAEEVKLTWLNHFLSSFLLILVLRITFFLLYPNWGDFGEKWWFYLFFGLIFYYIGWQGCFQVLRNPTAITRPPIPEETPKTNAFSKQELENLKVKIEYSMTKEHLYKNPHLSLEMLASHLQISRQALSYVINQGFEMNFNDYINKHRIQAFQLMVQDNRNMHLTLLGKALECGFNSKSTFNRVFKKQTGNSPQSFIQEIESQKII